jgi:ketosteroid isomerase-like protein
MRAKCVKRALLLVAVLQLGAGGVAAVSAESPRDNAALEVELREAETAFAQSMADRDHEAFVSHLDDETVFFSGERVLRGKQAVAEAWRGFFEGEKAPFSWMPEAVAVLDSGQLGLTSGPVFDPDGKRIGTFNSVWRRGADGAWKIVFDRGCPDCECP